MLSSEICKGVSTNVTEKPKCGYNSVVLFRRETVCGFLADRFSIFRQNMVRIG